MAKTWSEDIQGWRGLKYIKLVAVPIKAARRGRQIDMREAVIDRLVAQELLSSRNPITGKEVALLRKALGLSFEGFSAKLKNTHGTVFHWEKQEDRVLLPINEVAVRLMCAEELGVDLPPKFSKLIGSERQELTIEVSRAKKRYKPRKQKRTDDPTRT